MSVELPPDAPPVPPPELLLPDEFIIGALWQHRFTYVWAAAVGFGIVLSLPHLYKSLRKGYTWANVVGVSEDVKRRKDAGGVVRKWEENPPKTNRHKTMHGVVATLRSFSMWTPKYVGMDVGQIVLVSTYYVVLIVMMLLDADLKENSDRAGFLAVAQIPLVFLLATKNSLLSLVLGAGRGWEKINFLHRWVGRGLFLAATVHGSLWIRSHLQFDMPILGQQKETSGIAAFGILCVIVLASLKPVRVLFYQFFFIVHVLGFVSFFITLRYHTEYAEPWIFPALAFYGLDILVRMLRFRVKDATLIPCDDQMTLISVHDCDGGWVAGQHVRLRVFFDSRILESHPLTIMCAPPTKTCLSDRTLLLGARVKGDWTRALNSYARHHSRPRPGSAPLPVIAEETEVKLSSSSGGSITEEKSSDEADIIKTLPVVDRGAPRWTTLEGARVQVMLDGPYGGSSVDLGEYESALLIAGGSGVTFLLGVLDDIVGRVVRLGRKGGERTRRVEFAWCIKSYACVQWLAPQLMEIALAADGSSLDVHFSIFVTCLCDPEAVPPIPNCDVTIERPTCSQLLRTLLARPVPALHLPTAGDGNAEGATKPGVRHTPTLVSNCGGGLAMCAAGPESLIREAKNALARTAFARGMRLGKVACHAELYSL